MKSPLFRLFAAIAILSFGLGAAPTAKVPQGKTRIELKDGWFYLNGQKTLINALGYESGARPGQEPKKPHPTNVPLIQNDLKLIKAAGYNAVRTWKEVPEDELQLIQRSGLKMVFGLWLQPREDFSDPKVVEADLALIRKVLAYSKNYDCIIAYLIMNEPMPQHFHKVGAQSAVDLWTKAVNLIHELHPGIPVGMSGNAIITEWVDQNVFDFYGRNAYDYNDGHNWTSGYANAMRTTADAFKQGKPSMITEYGMSVSRSGGGMYGANTLQQQSDAMINYTRHILDSGTYAMCPFYFADGWWKGGDHMKHNDAPEAWFGFWGYKDLKDTVGYPRPVWHALAQYNQALIAEPKNQQFYQNEVPVECFAQPSVKKVKVIYHDTVIFEAKPDARGYLNGKISFAGEDLKDRELVFEAYDAQGKLVKTEVIIVLTGKDPIQWPTLELRTSVTDLNVSRNVPVEIEIKNQDTFSLGEVVRVAFFPHLGWERGDHHALKLDPKAKAQTISDAYQTPGNSVVLSIDAGVDIRYGKFEKTLCARHFVYPGTWADPLRVK
jgi:hypothetical protein